MSLDEIKAYMNAKCKVKWEELLFYSKMYGDNDPYVKVLRHEWCIVDNMYNDIFNENPKY